MQVKIGGFAAFCIAVVVIGGIVECVRAVAGSRDEKEETDNEEQE